MVLVIMGAALLVSRVAWSAKEQAKGAKFEQFDKLAGKSGMPAKPEAKPDWFIRTDTKAEKSRKAGEKSHAKPLEAAYEPAVKPEKTAVKRSKSNARIEEDAASEAKTRKRVRPAQKASRTSGITEDPGKGAVIGLDELLALRKSLRALEEKLDAAASSASPPTVAEKPAKETAAVDAGAADSGAAAETTDAGAQDATSGDSGGDAGEMQALQERVRALEEKLDEQTKASETSQKESAVVKQKVKELSAAIQFSGFFDVSVSTYENNPNAFELGTFEFDIKKEFNKYFQVGAALVFADKQAEMMVGFIDFHLFGGLIPARGNIFLESGLHLQVGKFDVPFGNDWQYYASLDRPTMSAPLTTAVLMDGGYNDVGFRVLGNRNFINYVGYVLKGAGNGLAAGGRLAFVPFNNPFTTQGMDAQPLDVGFGYLHDFSQTGKTEQKTYAVDVEARFEFLRLQTEYYRRWDDLQGLRLSGYQGSLFANFLDNGPLPFGGCVRYDTVHSQADDGSADDRLRRITLAGIVRPFEVTILKLEYLHYFQGNAETHGNAVFAQLVIGFK